MTKNTFAEYFFKSTACYSDLVALLDPETHVSLTFGDLKLKTNSFVKVLQEIGVKKNEKIGTFAGNSVEFLAFCLAANQIGTVICPLNPAYKRYEFENYFEKAKVKWILTEAEYVEKLKNADFVAAKGKVRALSGHFEAIQCFQNLILLPSGQDPNHNTEELKVIFSEQTSDEEEDTVEGPGDTVKSPKYTVEGPEDTVKSSKDTVKSPKDTVKSSKYTVKDEITPEDEAMIFFSSGTTGPPKGVILTQKSLISHLSIANEIQFSSNSDFVTLTNKDTVHGVLPFFHAGGFLTVFMMLVQGAKVVINRKFDENKFFEIIEKYQVTVLNVVPPILELLAFSPKADPKRNLNSLRFIYVGAAPVRKELENVIFRKLWNVQLIQLYGSTESGVLVFMVPKKSKFQEQLATKPGTCGIPLPGVQTKIYAPDAAGKDLRYGELLLKTSTQMGGYIDGSIDGVRDGVRDGSIDGVFDEDGFYRTGDLVRVDSDGFYYIVGRVKEMMKVRGWQVSPYELEEALRQKFSQIVDVGVVGLPDEKDGEQPAAVVVLAPGTMLSAGEIEAFVSENFVSYKRLTAGVLFLDSLPRTPSGKLDRRRLKEMLLELSEFDE